MSTADQRQAEAAYRQRIDDNLERLREPVANEIHFLAKVGELSDAEIGLLREQGGRQIEGELVAGRLTAWRVSDNGEVRQELLEAPQVVARRELARVLKDVSPSACQKAEAERQRLDQRRRRAEVLVQVAALDDALLLTAEQRQVLANYLRDRWLSIWRGHVTDVPCDPVRFASSPAGAMDLFSIPDDELRAIFRPCQIETFQRVQLPTHLEIFFFPDVPGVQGRGVAHYGLPLHEERERLDLLLERLVEDAALCAALDKAQQQKLLLAGKMDLSRYAERRSQQQLLPGKASVLKSSQIGGARVRLPPLFSDPSGAFSKALRGRLSPAQYELLETAQRERRQFHLEAVAGLIAVNLSQQSLLTDAQTGEVLSILATSFKAADGAEPGALLQALNELPMERLLPVVEEWQRPAMRANVDDVVATARNLLATGPEAPIWPLPGNDQRPLMELRP